MNHAKRLTICEVCKNKEFSPRLGVVCSLTSERPSFEEVCNDFENDSKMVARKDREEESRKNLSEGGGGDFVEESGSSRSPWGIVISVVVVLLLVFKFLIRCDRIIN